MTAHEEHTLRRRLLQRLGSTYAYTEPILPDKDWGHQPVRIVAGRPAPRTTETPREPRAAGPSALAFAALPSPEGAIPVPAPAPAPAVVAAPTPAQTLRDALEARGHAVLTRDGKLFLSNASLLTDEDRSAVKEHRDALLAFATPWPEPKETSLAVFLGTAYPEATPGWVAQEPPSLDGINDIILNFETNGLNWAGADEPIGVTIGTLDGKMSRYLPFGHLGGGNLDKTAVIRYLQREVRGKNILNANTRFDVHMGRKIDVDLEEQSNTVSDIMHWAALLDDHRKQFAVDVLARDYLGGVAVPRIDERRMAEYPAHEVARRAEYQAVVVAQLREAMLPEIRSQELEGVLALENEVIYPVCEMERNGSKIDVPLAKEMQRYCKDQHDTLMMEVCHEVGFAFEHTAAGWTRLLEHLGLGARKSYKEKVLTAIDHPTVQKAYRASQFESLNSKTFTPYLEKVDGNGILRFDINQLRGDEGGTVSGRFSIGYVQQVPNHDNHHVVFGEGKVDDCKHGECPLFPRRVFIADGCDYLEADAMQIEFRLLAHFMQNEKLLAEYRSNPMMSFHKVTWAMLKQYSSGIPYSHVKAFNFARQYGAKLVKLAVMMGFITEEEGDEIRAAKRWHDPRLAQIREIEGAYARMLPEGDALLDRASHLAKTSCDDYCRKGDALHRQLPHRGYVKTIKGRRSRFPNNYKTYIGLNRVLQGSGADVMKRKIVELHKERKKTGLLMRLTIHDSVGGDAKGGEETKRLVSEVLNQQSFPELRVPILWSVGIGSSWAGAK